jgi:antitoxin Phd
MWQIQEAKAHFSEVIKKAEQEGPQLITRHGAERAVLLSIADYRKLTAEKKDFHAFLLSGPKFDDLEIARDKDTGRDVELE